MSEVPARPVRNASKPAKSSSGIFVRLLPFGVGQFANGSPLLGTVFAASEIGALVFWWQNNQAATTAANDTNKILQERKIAEEALPEADREQWRKDSEAFQLARKTYVQQTHQQSLIGLAVFGGLWAAGAIEAIVNEPAPAPKKRSRRRSGFSLLPQGDGSLVATLEGTSAVQENATTWSAWTNLSGPEQQLGLGIKIEF